MSRDSGWLIESYFTSVANKPMWLRLFAYPADKKRPEPEWTEDSNLGLRFGRAEDAAWVAMLYPEFCCLAKVTEHVWMGGVARPAVEATPEPIDSRNGLPLIDDVD